MLTVIFLPAGTFRWLEGWLLSGIFTIAVLALFLWLKKHDPGLLRERASRKNEGKTWDKILLGFYTVFLLATLIICGLDAVRFRWTRVPGIVRMLAWLGFVAAGILIFRVYRENTFASEVMRIQEDRDHHVIKTGPYRAVRHPMYSAILLLVICLPPALGSFLGLAGSALVIIIFFIRTRLEDNTLRQELPGYREYTREVRYRLIPGVW